MSNHNFQVTEPQHDFYYVSYDNNLCLVYFKGYIRIYHQHVIRYGKPNAAWTYDLPDGAKVYDYEYYNKYAVYRFAT